MDFHILKYILLQTFKITKFIILTDGINICEEL